MFNLNHTFRRVVKVTCIRCKHTFGELESIVSKMKTRKEWRGDLPNGISKHGNSDMFNYATNKEYDASDLKTDQLKIWDRLNQEQLFNLSSRIPSHGFDEMIQLTKAGRLWQYPIDNEFGLEQERNVPFEDHIFLDKHLENFSANESIRSFMQLVIMGLSNNPHITAERKRLIIEDYRLYFESKKEIYRMGGFDINSKD